MNTTSDIHKTRFYSDCIGVFQGGGCRGAAFAGAYEAAFNLGVRFSEVAGTSAGAIVAALLAAGADPPFMLKALQELDFPSLLRPPTRSIFESARSLHWSYRLGLLPFRQIRKQIYNGGQYSSEGIEKWVESKLKYLLKINRRVQFDDLTIPLHVVAGDLSTFRARIWSASITPTQSVAHAVRASCSLPIIFQPLEEGTALLVDGGLVANLPHFLFAPHSTTRQASDKRLLLFLLQSNDEAERPTNSLELGHQIAAVAVDGATHVQLSFTPDVARILISTGSIKATDFMSMDSTKVNFLINSGRAAAETFIKNELSNTHASAYTDRFPFDEHEAYLKIVEQLYAVGTEVLISMPNTTWFWEIFPTVLQWRLRKVRVVCYAPAPAGDAVEVAKEKQRRRILLGMGVELFEHPQPSFFGFIFDNRGSANSSALIYTPSHSDYEPIATFYSAKTDGAAVGTLHDSFPKPTRSEDDANTVRFEAGSEDDLRDRLVNNVRFYRQPGVTLTLEKVKVSDVSLISRFVRAFRYKQIGSLVEEYSKRKLAPFQAAHIVLNDGSTSIVTPPVVEKTGSGYVALEGNTRFLYCLNNKIEEVFAVVVNGVRDELPGRPVPLHQVRITSKKHPPEVRIAGYKSSLFRDIERAVRPLENA